MADHGRFVWYELMSTDVAAAKAFYAKTLGWDSQDGSTTGLDYTLFSAGGTPVSGLLRLPEEAQRMGAKPRWMGYVGVDDVDASAARIKQLGGAVYVPPTDSNIGRISVVTDPQTATLALVEGLKLGRRQPVGPGRPGRVGWHELFAADWEKALGFYGELFGWRKADAEIGTLETYQLFCAGGLTIGGMFNVSRAESVPFWLYYFNVEDIEAAVAAVRAGGGVITEDPFELVGGIWVARCTDPQGATFALQGKRSRDGQGVGWSSEWSGISSRGRLVTKARG